MPRTELNGVNLFYELQGRPGKGGPAFVFVHGGMCDHRDWARQVRALRPQHTVLTLDLRGHGLSKGAFEDCRVEQWADDINALIDVLKLKRVVLTGHSLSTRIVVEAAARRPERIGALVLLDGSRMYGGFSADKAPSLAAAAALPKPLDAILEALIGPYVDSAMRAYLKKNLSAAPPGLMQATVEAIKDWDSGRADAAFAELRQELPMLVIQSTYHDRFTPRYSLETEAQSTPYLDFVKAACPGATIKTLIGVGHFSMLERSDEVTALIEALGEPRSGNGRAAPRR